ncbi:MAG: PIN domain-containing protein [Chloroflexi bacterium]|nr:PIN domain-containing protein [Chloroflexota bacterium]
MGWAIWLNGTTRISCNGSEIENDFRRLSAWIAIVDTGDSKHSDARAYYRELINDQTRLITSAFVLAETYTNLRYFLGHHRAVQFNRLVADAQANGTLQILWVDPRVFDSAWKIFEKYSDQEFSFADCTSFVLMGEHKIARAFAFDDDFRIMGFDVNS